MQVLATSPEFTCTAHIGVAQVRYVARVGSDQETQNLRKFQSTILTLEHLIGQGLI